MCPGLEIDNHSVVLGALWMSSTGLPGVGIRNGLRSSLSVLANVSRWNLAVISFTSTVYIYIYIYIPRAVLGLSVDIST